MKAGKFALSVQHGGGMHYFMTYPLSIQEGMQLRKLWQARLDEQWKVQNRRGQRGTAILWQRVYDD